jgi:hypothetical protein
MLKARRERLQQESLALKALLLSRSHAPAVQPWLSIAHRSLAETGEALAVLVAMVNGSRAATTSWLHSKTRQPLRGRRAPFGGQQPGCQSPGHQLLVHQENAHEDARISEGSTASAAAHSG